MNVIQINALSDIVALGFIFTTKSSLCDFVRFEILPLENNAGHSKWITHRLLGFVGKKGVEVGVGNEPSCLKVVNTLEWIQAEVAEVKEKFMKSSYEDMPVMEASALAQSLHPRLNKPKRLVKGFGLSKTYLEKVSQNMSPRLFGVLVCGVIVLVSEETILSFDADDFRMYLRVVEMDDSEKEGLPAHFKYKLVYKDLSIAYGGVKSCKFLGNTCIDGIRTFGTGTNVEKLVADAEDSAAWDETLDEEADDVVLIEREIASIKEDHSNPNHDIEKLVTRYQVVLAKVRELRLEAEFENDINWMYDALFAKSV